MRNFGIIAFMLLTIMFSQFSATAQSTDFKLVLIGVALDEASQTPIANTSVELMDVISRESQKFTTQNDGQFYFTMKPNKRYQLQAKDDKGEVKDFKVVSTVNKSDPEIIHAILQWQSSNKADLETSTLTAWSIEKPRSQTMASRQYEVPYDNLLTYKVQFAAFRRYQNQKSSFFDGIEGAIETERGENGYVRYIVGNFNDFEKAKDFAETLHEKGYLGSYIVAYSKGQRLKITAEEAYKQYNLKGGFSSF